jgi:hypothetical protein
VATVPLIALTVGEVFEFEVISEPVPPPPPPQPAKLKVSNAITAAANAEVELREVSLACIFNGPYFRSSGFFLMEKTL